MAIHPSNRHLSICQETSWPWSYGSWIYNYLCNQCLSPLMLWVRILIRERCTTLCDKVCQWLVTGRWFSSGSPVSSTNKTDRYNITEILLKVALNTMRFQKNTESFRMILKSQRSWTTHSLNIFPQCTSICLLQFHVLFMKEPYAKSLKEIPVNFTRINRKPVYSGHTSRSQCGTTYTGFMCTLSM